MITSLESTARIFRRVELQRLQKERDDLVTEHLELTEILQEMTEEIKDLEAQMDILTFDIETHGTTKDFRNDNSYLQKSEIS